MILLLGVMKVCRKSSQKIFRTMWWTLRLRFSMEMVTMMTMTMISSLLFQRKCSGTGWQRSVQSSSMKVEHKRNTVHIPTGQSSTLVTLTLWTLWKSTVMCLRNCISMSQVLPAQVPMSISGLVRWLTIRTTFTRTMWLEVLNIS